MRKKLDTRFPAARIKKIMQADEEVGKIALATPVLMSKALELFLQDLCDRTFEIMEHRGAKTLSASHLKQCLSRFPEYDFLKDIASRINDATADTPRGGSRGDVSAIGQSTSFGRGRRKQMDEEDAAVEDEDCFSPRASVPKMRQPKQALKLQKFCASSTEGRNGKSAQVCTSSRQEREKPELSASASDRKRQRGCAEEHSDPSVMHKGLAEGVATHRTDEMCATVKEESTTVSLLPGPVKHALDFDLNFDLNNSSVDEVKLPPIPTLTSQPPVKVKAYDSDEDYDAEDDGG